jgi:hypothetical protein
MDNRVLTRYDDVLGALRDPVLSGKCGQFVDSAALPPCSNLDPPVPPDGELVDLIGEFAQPWSNALAVAVTQAPAAELNRLLTCAVSVFESGSGEATVELAKAFAGPGVAWKIQAFVALTQTLPAFLGNAWLALLQHPSELELLAATPELLPTAMEELLRFAGPSQEVYRGEIVLRLADANCDPAKFPDPDRLDLRRNAAGHLAFGAGEHACAGAALIRKASVTATRGFIEHFRNATICGELNYRPTRAIRALRALPVRRA